MFRRCVEWPYVIVVDEDKPEESYTSEHKKTGEKFRLPRAEMTWINKEKS